MSTQVTISKKTIRKIAAAIAAVNNSREVGGLFMGYRHSSKYRIVDATVPDCEKCSGVASFVLDGAEETAKAEALAGRHTNTPEITVIFGEMRCFRYKTKSRIGDLHKSWETVFRLLHCQKNRVTYGNS